MNVIEVDMGAEELVDFTNKFANEVGIMQKPAKAEGIRKYLIFKRVFDELSKRGGPFIGPRGGKWTDPQMTIPWKGQVKRKRPRPRERLTRKRGIGRYSEILSEMKSTDVFEDKFRELNEKEIKEYIEKSKKMNTDSGREIGVTTDEVGHTLTKGIVAFVSAGKNPNLEPDMKSEEEVVRAEKLYNDLKKSGYAFTPVAGKYGGGAEDTFMVLIHDANQDYARKLGKQYNQDSILYVDKGKSSLWFTTGENEGNRFKGDGHDLLKGGEPDNYTVVPTTDNGLVKFRMSLDFDNLVKSMKLILIGLIKGSIDSPSSKRTIQA